MELQNKQKIVKLLVINKNKKICGGRLRGNVIIKKSYPRQRVHLRRAKNLRAGTGADNVFRLSFATCALGVLVVRESPKTDGFVRLRDVSLRGVLDRRGLLVSV